MCLGNWGVWLFRFLICSVFWDTLWDSWSVYYQPRCSRRFREFHLSWCHLKAVSAVDTAIYPFNQIGALTEHLSHFAQDPLGFLSVLKIHSLPFT